MGTARTHASPLRRKPAHAVEDAVAHIEGASRRGRGAVSNPAGRYEIVTREEFSDGWDLEKEVPSIATEVTIEKARRIITRNDSPDILFDRSINPYRGCEHGCSYCFARPSHAFYGLSSGLDFETKLFAKTNAPELLLKEISSRNYEPRTIALGTNTDPYQPIERRFRITRSILEILSRVNHPVGIVTKSALVTQDLDILRSLAERRLVKVALSITTLDPKLARRMEPRAASPAKRLAAMRMLANAGIPVTVLVAPVIPALNDHEIEAILDASQKAGAAEAGYVLLRLPHDLKDLMRDWLLQHFPDRVDRVLSILRESRGGRDYDSRWKARQTGEGPFAWILGRRFEQATKRLGLNERRLSLRTDLFRVPEPEPVQLALF
ncbi:PA0069 family radical SAM protein [Microvirga massiliensis]|uniref:PA0069 family radical SAM protein n=1 Tax=Microvirga massiliensis TaxID=1033741 RepID=UPI00062B835F|nr:PA0069 family radical SAM protein [Microvirga massiliensis]